MRKTSLIDNDFVRLKICRRGHMMFQANDAHVGRSLDQYGEYSEASAALFGKLVKPKMVVVEVGAHIGALTVWLAQLVGPRGRVIVFEPQRLLYQLLCGNLALNALGNVEARQLAAGRRNGQVHAPQASYPKGLVNDPRPLSVRKQGEIVTLVALDSLPLETCHFLKVNADGMEVDVIAGAGELLYRQRPLVYIENERRRQSPALIQRLLDCDYRLYWHLSPMFSDDNFFGKKRNVFGPVVSVNMLGIPKERDQEIGGTREITDPRDRWDAAEL